MRKEHGTAITESLIVATAVVMIMLLPVSNTDMADNSRQSLASYLIESIRLNFQAWRYAVALPEGN